MRGEREESTGGGAEEWIETGERDEVNKKEVIERKEMEKRGKIDGKEDRMEGIDRCK